MEGPLPKKSIRMNDIVYLVESCRRVREAVVRGRSGGLYTVRFTDTSGGIRLRPDRLYPTREAAQTHMQQAREARQQIKPAPGLWHNVPLWEC